MRLSVVVPVVALACLAGCADLPPAPAPAPASDPGLVAVLALLAIALLDDAIPVAGAVAYPAIPALIARLLQILAK